MLNKPQSWRLHSFGHSVLCAILVTTAPVLAQTDGGDDFEFETQSRINVFQTASSAPRPAHVSALGVQSESIDDFEFPALSAVLLGAFQDAPASDETPPAAPSSSADHGDLVGEATNPVAPLIQLQFQNVMVGESNAGDGYSNVFTIQPVIPWKIGEQQFISRVTLPFVATPRFPDPVGREYGLGDLVVLNVATWLVGKGGPWQGTLGFGPTFTFPTGSSDFTGSGKFQAGPTFVYINTAVPKFQWGVLAYQQWSFASSGGDSGRREVSATFFELVATKHFEDGWYASIQGDILMSVDWNDDRWNLPVALRLGRVTKLGEQPVNIFVSPFYDVSGNNAGNEWGVKLSISLLFPQ